MPKYLVEVTEHLQERRTIEVEAADETAAEQAAIDEVIDNGGGSASTIAVTERDAHVVAAELWQFTRHAIRRRASDLNWTHAQTIENILLAIHTCSDPGFDPIATLTMISEVMDRWDGRDKEDNA